MPAQKETAPAGQAEAEAIGREETVPHIGTVTIVGSHSANPIKFAFRRVAGFQTANSEPALRSRLAPSLLPFGPSLQPRSSRLFSKLESVVSVVVLLGAAAGIRNSRPYLCRNLLLFH
jgi:hypothetical protein